MSDVAARLRALADALNDDGDFRGPAEDAVAWLALDERDVLRGYADALDALTALRDLRRGNIELVYTSALPDPSAALAAAARLFPEDAA